MNTAAMQPANTLIREVVAVYESCDELDIAVTDLVDAGFRPTQLGLVARREGIRSHLLDAYREVPSRGPANTRQLCFVRRRGARSSVSAFLGGLGLAQSNNTGGPVVASSAVLAGAVGAFTAGVSVLGSSQSLQATLAEESEFVRLTEALDHNNMLLFVSSYNTEKLVQAKQVLEFSDSIDNGIVAYTVDGNPFEKAESLRLAS